MDKAKAAFASLRRILSCEIVELGTRQRILEAIVWNLLHYGLVAFELTIAEENKIIAMINSFEARVLDYNPWRTPSNSTLEDLISSRVRKFKKGLQRARLGFFGHLYRHPTTPAGSLLRERLALGDCHCLCRTLTSAGLDLAASLDRGKWRSALKNLR